MKTITRGVVHGKMIQLPHDTGLPEGQEVSITLEAIGAPVADGNLRWEGNVLVHQGIGAALSTDSVRAERLDQLSEGLPG
jgi:hypothetical protein